MGRLAARLGLAAVCLWLAGAPAGAHAVLVRAEPPAGAALAQAPARVRLEFNEAVAAEFLPLAVYDGQGARVDQGNPRPDAADPRVLLVDLRPLPPGFYTVAYRVSSADGHPVQGAYGFTVGPAAPAPAPAVAAEVAAGAPGGLPPAVAFARGGAQAAAVGLAGLAAFAALVWRPVAGPAGVAVGAAAGAGFRRWFWVLAGALVAMGAAEVGLYAVRAAGVALSPGLFGQALVGTRVGRLWLARAGLGLLVAIAPAVAGRREAVGWWGAAAAGGALLVTFSLQSHAAAAGGALPLLADWLHLAAAAPWMGGLLALSLVLPGPLGALPGPARRDFLGHLLRRFSPAAAAAVALLAATGAYAAWLRVPDLPALADTAYGRALLAKLALLLPLLALGAVNFVRQGQGQFRRRVAAELALAAGIFAAVGFLTSLPPARVARWQPPAPFTATREAGDLQVSLRIEPGQVGYNTALVSLGGRDGAPVTGAGVGLRVEMREHDMGRQDPDAVEQGAGRYRVDPVVFGMHGTWQVEVVILTPRGQEVRTAFTVPVPAPAGP